MHDYRFATREQASVGAANFIVAALRQQLEVHDCASMVVSGGSTPARCLTRLASENIDWSKVDVFLSDERWVPREHPDSNEKRVSESLLTAAAKDASLHGMHRQDSLIDQRCKEIDCDLRRLTLPFACVLLGMGSDGHFASIFADSKELSASLDLDGERYCMAVHTAASEHSRISLTLAALCRGDDILLLIFGEEKWRTLETARQVDDAYPVSRLLRQTRTPIHVFWAP